MNDILTELFIAAMYVGTILGMCMFLAFVCRMGDLGVWVWAAKTPTDAIRPGKRPSVRPTDP